MVQLAIDKEWWCNLLKIMDSNIYTTVLNSIVDILIQIAVFFIVYMWNQRACETQDCQKRTFGIPRTNALINRITAGGNTGKNPWTLFILQRFMSRFYNSYQYFSLAWMLVRVGHWCGKKPERTHVSERAIAIPYYIQPLSITGIELGSHSELVSISVCAHCVSNCNTYMFFRTAIRTCLSATTNYKWSVEYIICLSYLCL